MTAELHGDDYARGAPHDFAVNVSAEAWPSWLRAAIARGTEDLRRYPDERRAQAAVAARHGRSPEEVVLLNGGAHGFTLLAQTLRPRHAAVVHPSFSEPERALRLAGHTPERLILDAPYVLDAATVPSHTDLVVLGNPTNPTGALHSRPAVAGLSREGRITAVDEAFMDQVPGEPASLAAERSLPGLVVLRSLTKILAVPGVRAGYLLAAPELAGRLRDARAHWSVNAIALCVIEAACLHAAELAALAETGARRRQTLSARLQQLPGLRVHPGAANFLLLEMADAPRVHRQLLAEHGVATRPAWDFPGLDRRHLRVAVRGEPEDSVLTHALAEVLAG